MSSHGWTSNELAAAGVVSSVLGECHALHYCAGCDARIPPGERHIDHTRVDEHDGTVAILHECLRCARRNGRPQVAEPDVAEQPLDLEGIA